MARPVIMLSVILVYIYGALIAWALGGGFDAAAFAWGFAALLLVSLSIHYTNEYADYATDALTRLTPYSGGSGVLPSGQVPRALALQAAWVTLIGGLIVAVIALWLGLLSPVVLLLLIAGAVGGWQYSLAPLKLAWRGWGEADNAFLGGLLLPVYAAAAQTDSIDPRVIAACVPFMLLDFTNLLATTWADRHADAQVGKFTLATQHTPGRLRAIYAATALIYTLSWLLLAAPIWGGVAALPTPVIVGGFAVLPLVIWGFSRYTRTESPFPSVFTMIALLLVQMGAWLWVGAASPPA
ncbi:MAG: prenyltransferase [Chloroflexi bacterium]|nr:prenyltransferase [Chloroflexota bacterium]